MEKKTIKAPITKRGFITPLVVFLIVLLLLVGNGVLALGFYSQLKSVQSTSDIYARAAADDGLTLAMYKMNQKLKADKYWDNSSLASLNMAGVTLPDSPSSFSYTITGDPTSGFSIQSTGTYGRATRTIYATTIVKSLFDFAIAVKDDLTLFPNSTITGYDSKTGTSGQAVQVGTNAIKDGSVVVLNGAYVNGDVFVGIDGNPAKVIVSKGTITGGTYPLPQKMDFPEVYPPAGLVSRGDIKGTVSITAANSGQYGSISLGNSEVITVDGGGQVVLYVTGGVRMDNASEINIKPGTSLVMYVDGNWESKEGSGINNENGIPANFKLFGTGTSGQSLDLKAKMNFYGAVYAPNASIGIKAGGNMYGSFVGTSYEMKSKSVFSYDVALRNVNIDDEDARFYVRSWREE